MTRHLALAASLLTFTGAALAADSNFDRTLSTSGSPNISISTGSGYIHLRPGSDSEVHITGHIHAGNGGWFGGGNGDVESRIQQIVSNPPIHQSGSDITIGERHSGDLYRNISIDYEITLPRGSNLTASTGSGDIEANDVGASVKADSGSGSVRLRGVRGPATLQTGSGDIELNQTGAGEVHAQTGSGSIRLHDINGALRAQTGSGDIEASGKIDGDSRIGTGSGSVRLDLGPQAHLNLDASTGSGSIRTQQNLSVQGELNHHHVMGALNGGGPLLRINTGSGDIEIR